MDTSNVPSSVTFGKKVLFIPTLEEVGVPLAGLGTLIMEKELHNRRYSGGYWVKKGEKLFTYNFYAFSKEKSSFFEKLKGEDPTTSASYTITSPINGLVIANRKEYTVDPNGASGLRYEYCTERALPIILVPNDEPLPNPNNFYEYNSIASWLDYYFYLLPIRDRSNIRPERLRSYISRNENSFDKDKDMLSKRERDDYKDYLIREVTKSDYEIIRNVQELRSEFLDLRDKLVHISREFGESI